MSLLRSFLHGLGYPESRALGFTRMGLGIERRAERLYPYWQPHLERTMRAQERWVRDPGLCSLLMSGERFPADDRELLVLGAGRLIDFNLKALRRFQKMRLIDADPLCRPFWKRAAERAPGAQLHGEITELSGVLGSWRRALEASTAVTWDAALSEIRAIVSSHSQESAAMESPWTGAAAILSLNVLSQIPIVWQDCVERSLIRRFSRRVVRRREAEWVQALQPGAEHLVRRHLADLAASGADSILLICDLEYAQYSGPRTYTLERVDPAPVGWVRAGYELDLGGRWIESRAIPPLRKKRAEGPTTCEVMSALYGVDLEDTESRHRLLPGYRSRFVDSWLWHIQPQGLEEKQRGIVHRVGAFELFKEQVEQPRYFEAEEMAVSP